MSDTKVVEVHLALVPDAAKAKGKPRWRHVGIATGLVNVTGGFSNAYNHAPSLAIETKTAKGVVTHTFVKLEKDSAWFLKGVGGLACQKGGCKAVTVIQDLREKTVAAAQASGLTPIPVAAVADAPVEAEDDDEDDIDPMDRLAPVAEQSAAPKAKQPRGASKLSLQSRIVEVSMPTKPQCAAPQGTDMTTLQVYITAKSCKSPKGKGLKEIFLRSDGLSWLLAYAADQLHFQGIVPAENSAPQSRTPNCPEIDDLHVAWNFFAKQWEARFLGGEFAGTIKRFRPDAINETTWTRLQTLLLASPHKQWGEYADASKVQLKIVGKAFIIQWCKSVVDGESAAFEVRMGIKEQTLETPPKKTKHAHAGDLSSAVADTMDDDDDADEESAKSEDGCDD